MTVDFVNSEDDFTLTCKWFVGDTMMVNSFSEGSVTKMSTQQNQAAVGGFQPSYPPVR